jgi:hypothetical protein
MLTGFGIDLAGYSTGKTSLAFVEIDNSGVKATLLRKSALSKTRDSSDDLQGAIRQDVLVLRRCFALGPIAVDIPIDLQGLPNPQNPRAIWELTRRPIDRGVNAMPPFADRIGAPVARFAAVMREGNFEELLGRTLFEAYPAATLRMLKINAGSYKGRSGSDALISLCKTLNIESGVENDDDIDAIICAITAALPTDMMHGREAFKFEGPMPKGFRIPKQLAFEKIQVMESEFNAWMNSREGVA